MSDAMKTELLQPGQSPAGLPEGGTRQLGATHAKNSGLGEARGRKNLSGVWGKSLCYRTRVETYCQAPAAAVD